MMLLKLFVRKTAFILSVKRCFKFN